MDHRPPSRTGGKKRKLAVVDEAFERNAYGSFVSAANSISQLYQQSVQSQRRSAAQASKQTLVSLVVKMAKYLENRLSSTFDLKHTGAHSPFPRS